MGKATPILAPTPGLWNSIPSLGRINLACGSFLSLREHPGRVRLGFWWMATPSGMAADSNSAGWTPMALRFLDERADLPDRELQAIQKDGAGNLWVRARNAGVFEWPAGKAKFQRPKLPFPPENIGGVPAVDDDGRILLTTPVGLLIGDKKGWQMVDRSVGLRGTVYSAFEDRQHSLWIGLAGRGLAQWLGYREWESYSTESGLASDVVYENPSAGRWVAPGGHASGLVSRRAALTSACRSKVLRD